MIFNMNGGGGSAGSGSVEEGVLYSNGSFNLDISYANSKSPESLTISYDADCISVATTQYAVSYGYVRFGPVNLAKYSKLVVEVSNLGSYGTVGVAFVSNTAITSVADAIANIQESIAGGTSNHELTLDISGVSSENGYVHAGFNTGGVASTITGQVHSVRLEE